MTQCYKQLTYRNSTILYCTVNLNRYIYILSPTCFFIDCSIHFDVLHSHVRCYKLTLCQGKNGVKSV